MGNEEIIEEVRKIADAYFKNQKHTPQVDGKNGVFVTLKKGGKLRGCIGVIQPLPLEKGLVEATIGALNDPRFPPVEKAELPHLEIEVTLLSKPKEVKNINEIQIGRDGIIIEYKGYRGLLLPQVATEYGWGVEEFLDNTCIKAGLFPGCWTSKEVKIYKFEGTVIEERGI